MTRGAFGIVIIICIFCSGCKQKPAPPTPPVPVNLITATGQRVYYYDKYPATAEALSSVNLISQVQGYVTGLFFTEGTHITKGQKLYEIDIRLYQAAYDQAMANLKVAQNNQVQAQQDADRYTYLNEQNAVAKQVYDHAVIALEVAKSSAKASEEAVKTAKTNLNYATIYAPFDGTIGFSQVKLGNMVNAGQTILNTISTDNPMAIDFLINEKQLPAFLAIEKRKQDEHDSLFTILLPDNSLYPYVGKISVIDRAVDAQTGAIRVRLVFPNPGNALREGMSCVVRVHNLEPAPVLLIPGRAVVEQMGEYFVFVEKDTTIERNDSTQSKAKEAAMVENGPQHRVFQKKIQLGQTIGPNVIINGGIEEGDRIVIDGVQLLHDGSRVSLGDKNTAAGKGDEKGSKTEASKKN